MFWKRKPQSRETAETSLPKEPVDTAPKSTQQELEDAAKNLANSLKLYADASYAAKRLVPDDELKAARHKVQLAKKIVTEGRIAYALGRCLPEHMSHWHAWSQRDDFINRVGFEANNISSSRTREVIGARRIEVTTNDFTFNGRPYRLVFRDSGLSSVPGDNTYWGEVHFFSGDICVVKFDVSKDLMKEHAQWQFVDVKAFRIGTWMQDILDIAAQIEASNQRQMNRFVDDRVRQAANEIDLG